MKMSELLVERYIKDLDMYECFDLRLYGVTCMKGLGSTPEAARYAYFSKQIGQNNSGIVDFKPIP